MQIAFVLKTSIVQYLTKITNTICMHYKKKAYKCTNKLFLLCTKFKYC